MEYELKMTLRNLWTATELLCDAMAEEARANEAAPPEASIETMGTL